MEFNAMMPVVVPALLAPAFAALVIAAFVNASSLPAVAAVPPSPPAVVNAVLCPASAGFSIGAKANEKDSSAREARAKNLVYIYIMHLTEKKGSLARTRDRGNNTSE